MNTPITFFILGGCIICLIERTYATMNYIKYENEDYSCTVYKTFNIMVSLRKKERKRACNLYKFKFYGDKVIFQNIFIEKTEF